MRIYRHLQVREMVLYDDGTVSAHRCRKWDSVTQLATTSQRLKTWRAAQDVLKWWKTMKNLFHYSAVPINIKDPMRQEWKGQHVFIAN